VNDANDVAEISRAAALMMQALDGEISEAQKAELEALIESDDLLQAEWERLSRVKDTAGRMKLTQPPDELWEEFMDSVYRRVERGIGWILLSIGAIVLISYGLWQGIQNLIGDVTLPWYVKGGVLALLVGIVVLIVSIIREKFFVFRDDPYRNVDR
jgi:ferric-dicitrate binding protein FerR (iron transport regulator)